MSMIVSLILILIIILIVIRTVGFNFYLMFKIIISLVLVGIVYWFMLNYTSLC